MSIPITIKAMPTTLMMPDKAIPAYQVIIRRSEDVGGYYAICDMLHGGCVVQGATIRETQRNMIDAMEMYIEDYPEVSDYSLDFAIDNA